MAIDAAGPAQNDRASAAPAFADGPQGIVTLRNVLPDWAVRLLVGTLLLPALLTALDGFFRARRRRLAVTPWLVWLGTVALPVLLAWLWVRALGATGALEPPDAPMLPLPPLERAGALALGSVVLVLALGWFGVRPLILARAGRAREPGRGRPRGGDRGGAVHAHRAGLGRQPVRGGAAAARRAPVAVRRRAGHAPARLAGSGGGRPSGCCRSRSRRCTTRPRCGSTRSRRSGWRRSRSRPVSSRSPSRSSRRRCSPASPALLSVMRTRHRVAANAEPEPLRTRGPASYAGPGSLGGTESALRR